MGFYIIEVDYHFLFFNQRHNLMLFSSLKYWGFLTVRETKTLKALTLTGSKKKVDHI